MVLITVYNLKVSITVATTSVSKGHKSLSISVTDSFNCDEGKDHTDISTMILLVDVVVKQPYHRSDILQIRN